MTSRATEILDTLETLFEAIPGITVFRGMATLALPSETARPYIAFRPISNAVEAMQRGRALVTLQVGIEARAEGTDADLDDMLVALRGALGLGEFAPFDGLVTRSAGGTSGVTLGEAQYLFPQPGEATAGVQMIVTFRYAEAY